MAKETQNFFTTPLNVLEACLKQQPAAVVVVAMDDHGGLTVYGSHSAPITMNLLKQAPSAILSLRED